MSNKHAEATLRLLEVMDTLREQCPWDREQTFESLRNNTIEETYELIDAITDHNMEGIKEELGDLLLHVVFYSKLGQEEGAFDYSDVANGVCDKLIYRHPHVYGDIHADTPEEVKHNWEALKLRKKNRKSGTLGGVPRSLVWTNCWTSSTTTPRRPSGPPISAHGSTKSPVTPRATA